MRVEGPPLAVDPGSARVGCASHCEPSAESHGDTKRPFVPLSRSSRSQFELSWPWGARPKHCGCLRTSTAIG